MAVKGEKDVMNKAKVMTATATLVAVLGVVSHVNADEVDFSTATQNPEAQTNQTENNVTKADVNAAKADLDTANQAVSHQEQVVSDAATVADEARSTYNQAQQSTSEAQNLVDQATPENIASAQDDVNLAQEQVSQADNAERVAENTVAQAQEAVNKQTEIVNSAQTAVDSAQKGVDAAQKDVNDKQAILNGTGQAEMIANRDKAQADVNLAQNQVAQAESDLTKAQTADANRQQAIDNAQKAVDEANQNVALTKADLDAKTAQAHQTQAIEDAKQADVATAQKDVNDKQAILDGTGQKAILNEAEAAKNDEASKQANLSAAQSALKQAQEADAKRQQAIDNAQKAVDEANQTVTSSKSDLDAKTAQAQQTEQALVDAQSTYKTAENDYKAINTITLSQAYVEALKKYNDYSLSAEERQQVLKTLAEESEALAKVNTYKSNPNDDNSTKYQINDLPEDAIKELSLFAADLVNQIRAVFGSPQVTVTESSVKFVDLVTDGYVSDRWNVTEAMKQGKIGHDAKAVNKAAQYFGLPTSSADEESEGGQYYEDWASSQVYDGITFATLKQRVYQAVTDFMFNADGWRHARDIVGGGDVNSQVYFAIDFSRPSTENGAFAGVHFISISEDQASSSSHFDTTAFANTKSAENVTATYNAVKSALANAQSDNNVAQEAKTNAQVAYDNAVSNLSSASTALTQSQSVAIQTPTAKANLASAETALTKAQERLTKANKAVDDLNADIKSKQAALTSAKQVLSTKQATLATKQATLTIEQNRLASLQNSLAATQANILKAKENVVTAKANLTKVQTYLTRLQNAPELLAQAQQQEATAKANLLAALDTLEVELLKLKDLQVKQAVAQAVYDTTSKAYQTMLDAQEKQRLQDEYNAIIAQGKTPVAIVDETGKIVSYQAEDPQTTIQSSSVESISVKAQVKPVEEVSVVTASTLPMTGEHSSVLAVLFGCLMTIGGLVGVRRKNN